MDENDSTRIALQYRALEQRAAELQRQLSVFRQLLEEAQGASKTLHELPNSGAVLFSIGSGVMVRATPVSPDKVLVESGAGVVLEKTAAQAVSEQQEKAGKLLQAIKAVEAELGKLGERAEQLRGLARQ